MAYRRALHETPGCHAYPPSWRLHKILLAATWLASGSASAAGLTGDWGGARTSLAESGVSLRADVTGFATGQLAGDGDKAWDSFGRYDAFADIDFGKMGLAKGLGFHAHAEGRFGSGRYNFGGQVLPGNSAAVLPLGGDGVAVSSLYFTQAIGKRTLLMLGKINAVDLLAGDPIFGGWGTQRFQNIASSPRPPVWCRRRSWVASSSTRAHRSP